MTISVLMSTYIKEQPNYLDEAMRSIWTEQIRKPDQIVLVEDGPLTSALHDIVSKWKSVIGDKLTIIANKQNKGLALSLIEACKGELIARMDTDDIALPDRLKLEEEYMTAHQEVEILGGSLREFNDHGTLNKTRKYPQTIKDIKKSIHKASPLAHPTVMFRHTFFEKGFRYSNKYFICEDVTLWFEAVSSGVIINNISDIVLNFRRNDSVMKRRGRQKAWSEFRAYSHGIFLIDGLYTLKYIYPLMRLAFRLMPNKFIKAIYNSKLRNVVTT